MKSIKEMENIAVEVNNLIAKNNMTFNEAQALLELVKETMTRETKIDLLRQ